MIRTTIRTILIMSVLLCGFVSTATAADGAAVVVLKFETFETNEDVVDSFYEILNQGIDDHPDMHVKTAGKLTIEDLILTAGCDDPSEKCLSGMRGDIDADQLVFGSIQQSDDIYLITIRNFDFAEGAFVREVTDQTVQGDIDAVTRALPAVVDNFLYGAVGVLEISLVGASEAEVVFDGEKMGYAPTTLENLPLGEHAVTLKMEDGTEKTETIVLRHNEPGSLEFTFGDGVNALPGDVAGDAPSTVPGWVLVGVGAVGVGVGVYGLIEEGSVSSDFDDLCAKPGNNCGGSDASLGSPEDAKRAQDLTDRGSTAQTLQLIGFSVGGVALVAGAVMLVRAYAYEAPADDLGRNNTESDMRFSVAPTRDGVMAGMTMSF